ncbi:hypothetical protein [Moraxella catarrhalis]|nr:hypothetical protein [Moraxella catarrhalis]
MAVFAHVWLRKEKQKGCVFVVSFVGRDFFNQQ